jgi:KipI family sensor histidine kinase inhibitor
VKVGDEISLECNRRARYLFEKMRGIEGITEATVAYGSLACKLNLGTIRPEDVVKEMNRAWRAYAEKDDSGRLIRVPACYEEPFALDLDWIAVRSKLSKGEVIRIHSQKVYTCMMLGFSPGFVYLDDVDPVIACPRLETPRLKVPSGSVGIGGEQTGIYGVEGPGGWRIVGRTPLTTFNPYVDPPTLVAPGDKVKFEPISTKEFEYIKSSFRKPSFEHKGIPIFEVHQPGVLTTIQDRGRTNHRHYGVPRSGGLDPLSQSQANYIIGNTAEDPTLEVIGGHFKAVALSASVVCVTGAKVGLTLDGKVMPSYEAISLERGNEIALGGPSQGFINYISVAGGFEGEFILDSYSTCLKGGFGGYGGRTLKSGDVLYALRLPEQVQPITVSEGRRVQLPSNGITMQVVPGSVEGYRQTWLDFISSKFLVTSASDRMGCRLRGTSRLTAEQGALLTYPTYPGYVQLPPDGDPIVLQQDCQTTGGYMLLAYVPPYEMCKFSQAKPGATISFREVGREEVIEETVRFEETLRSYFSVRNP